MNTIYIASAEPSTYNSTTATEQPSAKKPKIICGACGAEEEEVEGNKTECPNCDEYIY